MNRLLVVQTMLSGRKTMRVVEMAWECGVFGRGGVHKLVYADIRTQFELPAQMVIRCISPVAQLGVL